MLDMFIITYLSIAVFKSDDFNVLRDVSSLVVQEYVSPVQLLDDVDPARDVVQVRPHVEVGLLLSEILASFEEELVNIEVKRGRLRVLCSFRGLGTDGVVDQEALSSFLETVTEFLADFVNNLLHDIVVVKFYRVDENDIAVPVDHEILCEFLGNSIDLYRHSLDLLGVRRLEVEGRRVLNLEGHLRLAVFIHLSAHQNVVLFLTNCRRVHLLVHEDEVNLHEAGTGSFLAAGSLEVLVLAARGRRDSLSLNEELLHKSLAVMNALSSYLASGLLGV